MKKIIISFLLISSSSIVSGQLINRPITGAVFQSIVPDARAGGLADMGVATSPDAYSQYWNPSKYLFNENYSGFAVSYTPWLNEISKDTFLLNATFFKYLGEAEHSTLAASIYYFNMGEVGKNIINPNGEIDNQGVFKPNEFAIDLSYGLLLSDNISMAVTGRFIRSDIYDNQMTGFTTRQSASTFAADISGYYQSGVIKRRGGFDSRFRLGANIKNIGPKLDYDTSDTTSETSLPTNLGIGASHDFIFSDVSTFTLGVEYNKVLVPLAEEQADGSYKLPDDGVVSGITSSLFGESASTIGFSAEYKYNDALAIRAGYLSGDEDKGNQPYVTTGIGLAFSDFEFDASYLIPTGSQDDPLANTLRFSLAWNFGGKVNNF